MKKGFSFEKHKDTGKILYKFRDALMDISVNISNAYGKTSKPAKLVKQAQAALKKLQHELDDRVCAENPNRPDRDVTSIYYGPWQ